MNLTYIFHVDGDVVHGEVKELPGCTVTGNSLQETVSKLILAQETWVDGWLQGRRANRAVRHARANRIDIVKPEIDPVFFETEDAATIVLNNLKSLVDTFGFSVISDFYILAQVEPQYIDGQWGWNSLDEAEIVSLKNGRWMIRFPDIHPVPLTH